MRARASEQWWQVDKVSPLKLFEESKTISGFNLRKLLFQQDGHAYVRSLVHKIYELWRNKQIQPIIDSCWAFEDVAEAMQKMHDRRNVGKITIDPAMEPKPKELSPPLEQQDSQRKRSSFIKTSSSDDARGKKDSTAGADAAPPHDDSQHSARVS